jgi:tetrahydromethanopterin S-methyltransferase subunit G
MNGLVKFITNTSEIRKIQIRYQNVHKKVDYSHQYIIQIKIQKI